MTALWADGLEGAVHGQAPVDPTDQAVLAWVRDLDVD
jgi:hypothetical protein